MKKSEKRKQNKRSRRERTVAIRKVNDRRSRQRQLCYPSFHMLNRNAEPALADAVMAILKKLRFNDRRAFSVYDRAFYRKMKVIGFDAALAEEKRECPRNMVSLLDFYYICQIGMIVFKRLQDQGCFNRFFPFCNVTVEPDQDDFSVRVDAMSRMRTQHGTAYYGKHEPTLMVDGQLCQVAFFRHALTRLCERLVTNWRSYHGYGDAYAYFAQSRYFSACELRQNGAPVPAFSIVVPFSTGFGIDKVAQTIAPAVPVNSSMGIRLGYCPIAVLDGCAIAKTTLFAGMKGTPESELISCSGLLSSDQKRQMLTSLRGIDFGQLLLNGTGAEALRWCHANGVPQVIPVPDCYFRRD